MNPRVALAAFLIACSFAGAAPAAEAVAKQLFQRGEEAYKEGRYAEAVELFLRAYEEDPHPALVYNVGQAYEKSGDVPNALRSYRSYLRLAPQAEDRGVVELRVKHLEERLRERGVQQVTVISDPAGADVDVNGRRVGTTPWTGELKPGSHTVVVTKEGFRRFQKSLVLTPDRAVDVDVALAPDGGTQQSAPPVAAAVSSDTPSEPRQDATGARVQPWTWAALGLGGALLGTSAVFEMSRASAERDAEDATTQLDHQEHYSRMESRQTTARVLFGAGAVVTVVGGALLVMDLSKDAKSQAKLDVGPHGAFLSARRSF